MKVIIIEDEFFAYQELKRLLQHQYPNIEIVAHFDTVASAIKEFEQYNADLLFLDISLPDGHSFEFLNAVNVTIPIIFTTAFDNYAIKAFKYNSIDYLLKPIDAEALDKAITKYKHQYKPTSINQYSELAKLLMPKKAKQRFLTKTGDKYSYVNTQDIAYFYSEDKTTYIKTLNNKSYITDYTLGEIEELVDDQFFRISRNLISSIPAIASSAKYFNSRLKIELNPPFNQDVLIARARVKDFLDWLGQ